MGLLPTGVPGLDAVLGGGLSRGSLVFLTGSSGAGKTVLGSQILHRMARERTPVLILTAFSESHVKLLEHLGPFSFFDPNLVGTSITMLSVQSLIGQDTDNPATAIIRAIRESGAGMVLIDGFQGVGSLLRDRDSVRQLVASLAGQLPYLDATLLVTHEGSARDPASVLELATADIVIGLEYTVDGWRHSRRLEIVKQRGRGPLPGMHSYAVTSDGINVYPRLETLLSHAAASGGEPPALSLDQRATFGLPELDALLGGGLTCWTNTLLCGAPGTGKTTLALHWALAPFRTGEREAPTIFLSFGEHGQRLAAKAASFGLDLVAAIESGALRVLEVPAVEVNPDVVANRLVELLRETKARRMVVDDLGPPLRELGPRAFSFCGALADILHRAGATGLFLLEIAPLAGFRIDLASTPIAPLGENVIMIQQQQYDGTLHRILAVLKMRFSNYDRTMREFVLDQGGIRVLTPTETAPGLLAAVADLSGGQAPLTD